VTGAEVPRWRHFNAKDEKSKVIETIGCSIGIVDVQVFQNSQRASRR